MTTKNDKPAGLVTASMATTYQAADEKGKGTFRALVSAYGVKYRIGYATWHTIEAGAFAKSLAEQASLPGFWMHGWDWSEQPPIGKGTGTEETEGLVIDGQWYVDLSETARLVHQSMKDEAIREWSITYVPLLTRVDPDDPMHLFVVEAEIWEFSSVLRGANPDTETLEVAARHNEVTRTRVQLGELIVDTADSDLVDRLLLAGAGLPATPPPGPAPAPTPDPTGNDLAALPWAAQRALVDAYGDDLIPADDAT